MLTVQHESLHGVWPVYCSPATVTACESMCVCISSLMLYSFGISTEASTPTVLSLVFHWCNFFASNQCISSFMLCSFATEASTPTVLSLVQFFCLKSTSVGCGHWWCHRCKKSKTRPDFTAVKELVEQQVDSQELPWSKRWPFDVPHWSFNLLNVSKPHPWTHGGLAILLESSLIPCFCRRFES